MHQPVAGDDHRRQHQRPGGRLGLQGEIAGAAAAERHRRPHPPAQRLGLRLAEGAGGLQIKQVLSGSAALAAGLSAGDEILGCNGWRLRKFDDALLTLAPEHPERMELLVAREQRLLTLNLQLPLQPQAGAPVRLSLADKASALGLSLRRAWLGS